MNSLKTLLIVALGITIKAPFLMAADEMQRFAVNVTPTSSLTPIDAVDHFNRTPLHLAAMRSNRETVRSLITKGASPKAADDAGWTTLHYIACNGLTDCVALLVAHKADINAQNHCGLTALHQAYADGNTETASRLLALGARPDIVDIFGQTPFDCHQKRTLLKQTSKIFTIKGQ